jgi:hypothetical protein
MKGLDHEWAGRAIEKSGKMRRARHVACKWEEKKNA